MHATEILVRRGRLVENDGEDPNDRRLVAMIARGWVTEGHRVLLSSVPLYGNGEVGEGLRLKLSSLLPRGGGYKGPVVSSAVRHSELDF